MGRRAAILVNVLNGPNGLKAVATELQPQVNSSYRNLI